MTMNEADLLAVERAPAEERPSCGLNRARRLARVLDADSLVSLRYLLVAGAIGVPASILQLTLMLWVYTQVFGGYGALALNLLWLLNFEIGLLRNFALHCRYTWRMSPTRVRLQHAHVAALGALVIDLGAFNGVVFLTGIVPLALLAGAASGFGFNYGYNKLKTFAGGGRRPVIEQVTP